MVSWEEGQGLVLRGSLTVMRRRCGSPGCHCARGELHETPVLSYKQEGKTQAEEGREALRAHLEAARAKREPR